jgi:hypothetical protein
MKASPAPKASPARRAAIPASPSDVAVHRATGRDWNAWFRQLDKSGAAKLDHKTIARGLGDRNPKLSPWWAQMITVHYERARGLRVKHQKCDGSFSASISKTVGVPVAKLYEAWIDSKKRQHWLPDAPLHIRKANKNKSLRITWDGGPSIIDVQFLAKGASKSQVALDHEDLPNLAAVPRMQAYWRPAVGRLKVLLET